jgi:hypothetical protein
MKRCVKNRPLRSGAKEAQRPDTKLLLMRPRAVLVLVVVVLAAARAGAASRCAIVEGEAALIEPVRTALAVRGVADGPQAGCDPVRARVAGGEGALRVALVDGAGHAVERQASTPTAAATVIESWATDPLLERDTEPEASSATAAHGRPMVAVAAEASMGSDGSIWTGPRVTGCAWLGPVCGGVTLRLGRDGGLGGDAQMVGGRRDGVDMLLAADLPSRTHGLVISPGVALGFGWIRSHGREADGQHVVVDWTGARAEAHVALATPLFAGLWLYAAASATILPGAETGFQVHDGVMLAAEPSGFARLAIGLSSSEAP